MKWFTPYKCSEPFRADTQLVILSMYLSSHRSLFYIDVSLSSLVVYLFCPQLKLRYRAINIDHGVVLKFVYFCFYRQAHWITCRQRHVYKIKQMTKVWRSSKAVLQTSGHSVAFFTKWCMGRHRLLSFLSTPRFKPSQTHITKSFILLFQIPGCWTLWRDALPGTAGSGCAFQSFSSTHFCNLTWLLSFPSDIFS